MLPVVIDVEEAMAPDAPILHDDLFTAGVDPEAGQAIQHRQGRQFKKGDVEAGFAEADVIVEGRYTTQPVHQGYIEPHACLATYAPDGQVTIHGLQPGSLHDPRLHVRSCSASTSPTSRSIPPRSAAASAARRWSISSRSPSCCRRSPAGRSRCR